MTGFSIILIGLLVVYFANHAEAEAINGEELGKSSLITNPVVDPIKSVDVDDIDVLPSEFSLSQLPRNVQPLVTRGSQVTMEHLGVIDMLLGLKPDDPFKIDTQFHVFNGGLKQVIPFKLINNCVRRKRPAANGFDEEEDEEGYKECRTIPFDLNEMLNIFDLNKRTLIIIGGFLTHSPSDWQLRLADKWLQLEDINVIIVSWNKGNKFLYHKAVANTKVVARQVVILLYYLARIHNIDPRDRKFTDNIMIVGHSLGAHIAGFIGQDFGGRIGRITGLDPAGPSFSASSESHRLDRNDALLVDVIHTNADFGFKFFLGLYTPVGHIDYYANDGKWQPNCHLVKFFECNHSAVINYYLSILDHELTIRGYFDSESRDNYRIVAYRSKTYNQFKTGHSIHEHCPSMAQDGQDTMMQAGMVDFRRCGIPIDFVKRPREFRKELEKTYKINFSPDHQTDAKFYFFTSAKAPYVVDHNLIKLHYELPDKQFGFDPNSKQCLLKMTNIMMDQQKSETKLAKFKPTNSHDEFKPHPHTTLPFVVTSSLGRYMLIDIDSDNYYISDLEDHPRDVESSIARHAYRIFPAIIELKTERIPDKSEKRTARATRWLFGTRGSNLDKPLYKALNEAKMCEYKFKTVRAQPLRKTNRLFMAIYTTNPGDPNKGFMPRIIVLNDGESVPEIPISEAQNGVENPKLYLNAIVIGPNHFDVHQRGVPLPETTPYSHYLNQQGKAIYK